MSEGKVGLGEELGTVGTLTKGNDIKTVKVLQYLYLRCHTLETLTK